MTSDREQLGQYRSMRRFERTPEPAGDELAGRGGSRFVVQEHHATALHWDFRLERDGVLVSWAVPKGLPPDPRQNNLAVHTEDHPLEYLTFEGEIPEGEYGGGLVKLWDTGTYECEKWTDGEVRVVLHGARVDGRYVLFRTGGRNWMVHRMDPPQDPTREPLPDDLRPAVPQRGRLPSRPEQWSFEVAWGGERVVVSSQGGRLRVTTATGGDVTEQFPELRPLGRALGAVETALEGELVVLDDAGRPDAALLERRLGASGASAVRRGAQRHPSTFLAADLVWLEGHSTAPLPYTERRRLLEELALSGPAWQTVPGHPGAGAELRDAARAQDLPGVLARRLDAPYGRPRFVPAS